MEFDKLVKIRKSVRRFKKKKPSWKLVLEAIDLANEGPFANNHNHLRYLIVEDEGLISSVAGYCEQPWINQSKILVVVCSDDTYIEGMYGERGRVYSRQQAGAAIYALILALKERGIDTCWVGSYSDELLKEKLGIPQHIQVEAILPLGFEDGKSKKPVKKKLESSLNWELWGQSRRPSLFEEGGEGFVSD